VEIYGTAQILGDLYVEGKPPKVVVGLTRFMPSFHVEKKSVCIYFFFSSVFSGQMLQV
jgi:hypothetical protein